jgi:DNA-binding MarR family transcriptional regulator
MRKLPRGPLSVVADHRDGWYYASDVGEHLAEERSELAEMVRMRRFDIERMICADSILPGLGLPKLTPRQMHIVRLIVARGRIDAEGFWAWTGMRGHAYLNISLAHETGIDRHNISTVVAGLRKVGLVDTRHVQHRPTIRLLEQFHRLCFEAVWREMLHNTNEPLVTRTTKQKGWKWLLRQLDEQFKETKLNPVHKESRQRLLNIVVRTAM